MLSRFNSVLLLLLCLWLNEPYDETIDIDDKGSNFGGSSQFGFKVAK